MPQTTSALESELRALDGFKDGRHSSLLEEIIGRIEGDPASTPDVPPDDELPRWIDHTLLSPDAAPAQLRSFLKECRDYGFASACINPCYVPLASEELEGSEVKVCTVVGFPLGSTLPTVKRFETSEVIESGAQEVDMVLPVGALKGGEWSYVREDISYVVEAAEESGRSVPVKVILETALLSDAEKAVTCLLAEEAGADFVKTSTGFSTGGATLHDVQLMHQMVGGTLGIKASGGVGSRSDAHDMIKAGATRIGASGSVQIVSGTSASASY